MRGEGPAGRVLTQTGPMTRTATYTRLIDTHPSVPVYFPPMNDMDPAAFYEMWSERLRSIGIDEYGISAEDAEQLAHEVLLSSLHAAHADATPEIWLPATMRSACRHHVARRPPGKES